ncbi:PREDICTED: heme transporter hrg1-A-like [Polistes dominula]|uniref:Heme transporter hrg1-A-like n=1 Tax=Polistes dominula TaxID=743375 RepID=A0ABM1J661_POLDO|nr:PREDICTED: heme transporter hrg1-A-like [Polistes dominula]
MTRNVSIHLILSAKGIILGIIAFFVLSIGYGNHEVGFWSILSGILASICFHLNWVKDREGLDRWHTRVTLRHLNVVGFISAVSGITAWIWYLFLTFYQSIPLLPISQSTAITAVWAFICGTWGMFLMFYSNKYELFLQEGTDPILNESTA